MGEYGIRKNDGLGIKMGTCETMYYLRTTDKDKVVPQESSEFGWFWRIPFPDEDHILLGEYTPYNRGERLYKDNQDFNDPETIDNPGIIQLTHNSGLIVSISCYHGLKLPKSNEDIKIAWNGKSWFFELTYIKTLENDITKPVVRCRWCNKLWSYDWEDILPYLNGKLKRRLQKWYL
jgi:hypothetical protein